MVTYFQCFPFAISELSTLYSQTTILSNASYYFQENRATLEKFFPTLEKLFSTLEKSFSRHEKKFSSPALIFENKLSLFNMANAFHISPPSRCKKRCASLSSPMDNVAHAHGERCPRPWTTLPTPEDNEQERFSYRRRRALCHRIVCARAVRPNKPKHRYVAATL